MHARLCEEKQRRNESGESGAKFGGKGCRSVWGQRIQSKVWGQRTQMRRGWGSNGHRSVDDEGGAGRSASRTHHTHTHTHSSQHTHTHPPHTHISPPPLSHHTRFLARARTLPHLQTHAHIRTTRVQIYVQQTHAHIRTTRVQIYACKQKRLPSNGCMRQTMLSV